MPEPAKGASMPGIGVALAGIVLSDTPSTASVIAEIVLKFVILATFRAQKRRTLRRRRFQYEHVPQKNQRAITHVLAKFRGP